MSSQSRHHAVVIGASMGGCAAARVLADHFERVTVLDRDDIADDGSPRRAVPQGRHAHAVLAGGANAIEALFLHLARSASAGQASRADARSACVSGCFSIDK